MTDELTYIAEGLRSLAVPIDELHVDPANARTAHALDRIATSLKAYGQHKPIYAAVVLERWSQMVGEAPTLEES